MTRLEQHHVRSRLECRSTEIHHGERIFDGHDELGDDDAFVVRRSGDMVHRAKNETRVRPHDLDFGNLCRENVFYWLGFDHRPVVRNAAHDYAPRQHHEAADEGLDYLELSQLSNHLHSIPPSRPRVGAAQRIEISAVSLSHALIERAATKLRSAA